MDTPKKTTPKKATTTPKKPAKASEVKPKAAAAKKATDPVKKEPAARKAAPAKAAKTPAKETAPKKTTAAAKKETAPKKAAAPKKEAAVKAPANAKAAPAAKVTKATAKPAAAAKPKAATTTKKESPAKAAPAAKVTKAAAKPKDAAATKKETPAKAKAASAAEKKLTTKAATKKEAPAKAEAKTTAPAKAKAPAKNATTAKAETKTAPKAAAKPKVATEQKTEPAKSGTSSPKKDTPHSEGPNTQRPTPKTPSHKDAPSGRSFTGEPDLPTIKYDGPPRSRGGHQQEDRRSSSRPERKPAPRGRGDRPFQDRPARDDRRRDDRPFQDRPPRDDRRRDDRPFQDRPPRDDRRRDDRPPFDRDRRDDRRRDDRPFQDRPARDDRRRDDRPFQDRPPREEQSDQRFGRFREEEKPIRQEFKKVGRNPVVNRGKKDSFKLPKAEAAVTWPMRLNKFVAACGVCARRAAAVLVKEGKVKVNNEVVLEPGILVNEKDVVEYNGKVITPSVNFMYILLNKPKNTITTTSDERGRDSVLDLINEARDERLYPVGRLDRQTTGLLLLTNDGELTQRLAHPSNEIKKIYQVDLDRAVSERDLERIADGVMLEDGVADVDAVGWAEPDKKSQVILELHSGKNRVVRRIFEALGYQVDRLDRIGYAGLTKKDLPRGRYRHLTDREVIMLRHFVGRKKNLDDQTGV